MFALRLLLPLFAAAFALESQPNDSWKKLDFLLGEWTGAAGEKDTPLGAGQGAYSFEPQLQNRIIVRRNQANYDSGTRHDDLMVIYLDAPDSAPQAIYWDNEGHVIRYRLAFPAANRVVFQSDGAGPKYRLTYWLEGGSLNGRFEVGAPAGDYKTYMSWTSKKR